MKFFRYLLGQDWFKVLIKNKLLFWFMETKFYDTLIYKVIPKLRWSNTYTKMQGKQNCIMHHETEVGDIVFSVDYRSASTMLIGGAYAHVGVVIYKDVGSGVIKVAEMVGEGYREVHLSDFCYHADDVALMRINDSRWTPQYINHFVARVRSFKGHAYNRAFISHENEDGSDHIDPYWKNRKGDRVHKSHYCSQMVTDADTDDIINADWSDIINLGVPYISPDGLFSAKNGRVLYVTKNGKK